jgi:hypothetical protein
LKHLQHACTEFSGLSVFQASPLAALTSSDFEKIVVEKPPNTAASRHGDSRASATPHSPQPKEFQKKSAEEPKESGKLIPVSAGKQALQTR